MYGSSFRMETFRPRAFSSRPMLAAVIPLPSEEVTPPVTKTYFDMGRAPPGVFRMLPKMAPAGNDDAVDGGADGGERGRMFRLDPMDEATFLAWRETTKREYAAEKVKAGNYPEENAAELAEAEFAKLLPDGRHTAGHEIRSMVNETGDKAGYAWFTIETRDVGRVVFIYDIAVHPAHRRHGYARLALAEIDAYAREHECLGVMLHVFGDNEPARNLYRSAGYVETNVIMLKRVEG